jgi:hypothetical protein
MMVTDFAVSNALVVLERAQVQSLLDEMALTEAGYAEAATGARAGRLLRAEHVVQGVLTTLGGDELRTDAAILNVPSTASVGELSEMSALQELFDMEKALVIRTIREVLRVELTPAEEQAILDNRMDNVLAFVAYGRGLREMDRGDYAAAAASFRSAQQLEGFDSPLIADALNRATNMADASSSTTTDLVSLAGATGETGRDGALGPPTEQTTGRGADFGGTLRNLTEGVAPTPTTNTLDLGSTDLSREETRQRAATDRQPIAETTGGERLGVDGRATIRLVIPRPGGER